MMEAFLTVIFVFIAVGWLLSKFGPMLLARWLRKKMENFSRQGETGYGRYGRDEVREGDTVVSINDEKEKIVERNVGEYVEFTESEEKKEE